MTAAQGSDDQTSAPPTLFAAVQRRWTLVLAAALGGIAFGLVLSGLQTTTYSATATVLLDEQVQRVDIGETGEQRVDPGRRLLNEVQRMRSPEVIAQAKELAAGVVGANQLSRSLSVSAAPRNDLLRVTIESESAEAAAALANAVVSAYQEVVREDRQADLDAGIAALSATQAQRQTELEALSSQLQSLVATAQAQARRVVFTPSEVVAEANRRLSADPTYQQLVQQQATAQASLASTNAQIDKARLDLTLLGDDVSVVTNANVPSSPVQPKPARNAALGLVIGLLGGVGAAWWAADRERIITSTSVGDQLGAPQFALIPRLAPEGSDIDLSPFSAAGNGGRTIAAALLHRFTEEPGQLIVVTGLRPRSGSTLISIMTAAAIARTERTTVLIDANPGAPGLTQATNATNEPGVADLYRGRLPIGEAIHRFPLSDVSRLFFVASGRGSADPTWITSSSTANPINKLRANMDVIILDAPPLLSSAAAMELAGAADLVLLVVPADVSSGELESARSRLNLLDANLTGFVTNEFTPLAAGHPRLRGMLQIRDVPLAALPPGRSADAPAAPPSAAPPNPMAPAQQAAPSEAPLASEPTPASTDSETSTALGFVLPRRGEPD